MAIQENPYLPPSARVEDAEIVRGNFVDGGRAVPAGHGWEWIAAGWATFRQQPGTWMLVAFVLGVVVIAISLVPFLGSLAMPVLMPVLVGGLMLACARIERSEDIGVGDLFSGFQRAGGPLVILGLIGFGLTIVAIIPAMIVLFMVGFGGGGVTASSIMIMVLVYIALLLPVYMALWFGPPLVALQELPPGRAIAQSFRGCLKNVIPFLVYSAILLPLAVVASLPLFLGWLVLGPAIVASTYAAYRDIFFED